MKQINVSAVLLINAENMLEAIHILFLVNNVVKIKWTASGLSQ